MGGQVLLPGLSIVDLVTLSEAVPVGIDPPLSAHIQMWCSAPIRLDRRKRGTAVDSISGKVIAQDIADLRVELGPGKLLWVDEGVQKLLGDGAFSQIPLEGAGFSLLGVTGQEQESSYKQKWKGTFHACHHGVLPFFIPSGTPIR